MNLDVSFKNRKSSSCVHYIIFFCHQMDQICSYTHTHTHTHTHTKLPKHSSSWDDVLIEYCFRSTVPDSLSSIFRERKQKGLQRKCETRMALLWQEDGELLTYNPFMHPIMFHYCIYCCRMSEESACHVSLIPLFATGCCGLRVGDVVLYIPQSYPFCSHWSRYLCQDIHPLSSKGACMCGNASSLARLHVCIYSI